MTRSIAVTGGLGFIGRHIVRGFVERGDRVRVLDIAADPELPGVEYRKVDITDPRQVEAGLEGVDAVVHNASVVHTKHNLEDLVWAVNLDGTRHVLEACQHHQIRKLIYISSGSVVYEGKDIENGDEALPYSSISQAPYADAKIAAEKLVLAANGKHGVATCALRPHVVFGPGDTRFLPALLAHSRAGRLRVQVGRGTWLSDYTYVTNLADAVLLAEEKLAPDAAAAGSAYFITNGEPMPFWGFVHQVIARLDLPPVRFKVPHQLVYGIAAIREGIETLRGGKLNAEDGLSRFAIRYMCTHHYFSIEKARRELGYEPRVSVAQGIELTCKHLEETGQVEAN